VLSVFYEQNERNKKLGVFKIGNDEIISRDGTVIRKEFEGSRHIDNRMDLSYG